MPKKLNPFYEKMLKAKEAKKAMTKKDKQKKQEDFKHPPKVKQDKMSHIPEKKMEKRIETTAVTYLNKGMKQNDTTPLIEAALNRIREQSQNL